MIICIDIGNTHIYGGIFANEQLQYHFRYHSQTPCTSDTFGLFLTSFLKHNDISIKTIKAISMCSVVPSLDYSIISACKKYFGLTPITLKAGIKTGLKLCIKNPLELGADRVSNAVAATHQFPNRDLAIVDFGTATSICIISKTKEYLGGTIMPGIKLSMESLAEKAAKLANVEIQFPDSALGKSTDSQLQSGLLFGQIGAVKEIIARILQATPSLSQPMMIATGGYSHLFRERAIFDVILPDLVLHGLNIIYKMNQKTGNHK